MDVAVDNVTDYVELARDESLARIEIIVQSMILCLALIGNAIVIAIIVYRCRRRCPSSTTNRMLYFIGHLALADLAVAMGNVLPQLAWDVTYRFKGGDSLCKSVKYLQMVVIYAASGATLLVGYDRYLAVCRPFTTLSWSRSRAVRCCTLVWIISAVLAVPQVVIFSKRPLKDDVMDCWAVFTPQWTLQLYVVSFAMVIYFIPLIILFVIYARITLTVMKHINQNKPRPIRTTIVTRVKRLLVGDTGTTEPPAESESSTTPRRHNQRSLSSAKVRTIQMTFVVVCAYVLCWSPFVCSQLLWTFTSLARYNHGVFTICLLLASLNSCVNPFVYLLTSGYCCHGQQRRRRRASTMTTNTTMTATAQYTSVTAIAVSTL